MTHWMSLWFKTYYTHTYKKIKVKAGRKKEFQQLLDGRREKLFKKVKCNELKLDLFLYWEESGNQQIRPTLDNTRNCK